MLSQLGIAFGFADRGIGSGHEVKHQTFGQRLHKSLAGVGLGFVIFIGSFAMLGWNEGRTVYTAKAIAAGKDSYVTAECSPVDEGMAGKLVYMSCDLNNLPTFSVPSLDGVVPKHTGVFLKANVEMYQFVEKESCYKKTDTVGGGQTTTCDYSYSKALRGSVVDSSAFKTDSYKNTNPKSIPTVQITPSPATGIQLGSYTLSTSQLERFSSSKLLTLTDVHTDPNNTPFTPCVILPCEKLTPENTVRVKDTMLNTYGTGQPQIGDVQVSFLASTAKSASVIAEVTQEGGFKPWVSPDNKDYTLDLFSEGKVDAATMFVRAEEDNNTLAWVLRFLGFACMWMGLQMIAGPVALFPELIPCIGQFIGPIVGLMLCGMTGLTSVCLSLLTIALSWISFRPVIGGSIIAAAIVVGVGAFCYRRCHSKKSNQRSKVAPPPRPPPNPYDLPSYPPPQPWET